MKRWTDTEYVDTYQRYGKVPSTVVALSDHEQALAEKERAYKQEIGRHKDTIHDLIVRQAADSAAYQQLLAQAVRFAQLCAVRVVHSEAGDFLACPEAQAFLKERL